MIVATPKKENHAHTEGGCFGMLLFLVCFIIGLVVLAVIG